MLYICLTSDQIRSAKIQIASNFKPFGQSPQRKISGIWSWTLYWSTYIFGKTPTEVDWSCL